MLLEGCSRLHLQIVFGWTICLGPCWAFGLFQTKTCSLHQQSLSSASHWRPRGKILLDSSVSKLTTACQAPFRAATSILLQFLSITVVYHSPLAGPKSFVVDIGGKSGVGLHICFKASSRDPRWAHGVGSALLPLSSSQFCHCFTPFPSSCLGLWSTLPPTGLKQRVGRWLQFPSSPVPHPLSIIHLWWV